jgi:hypothetical protein
MICRNVLAVIAAACITGCSYGGVYAGHTSHPTRGEPFESSKDSNGYAREGATNDVGIVAGWSRGRFRVEQTLSYDLSYDPATSLIGGPFLYRGTVSFMLFGKGGER